MDPWIRGSLNNLYFENVILLSSEKLRKFGWNKKLTALYIAKTSKKALKIKLIKRKVIESSLISKDWNIIIGGKIKE